MLPVGQRVAEKAKRIVQEKVWFGFSRKRCASHPCYNSLACAINPCYIDCVMARSSTSYRAKWKSGNTTVVRVPEVLAPEILHYAHDLDDKRQTPEIQEPVVAYRTAEHVEWTQPVNVASVPQRSPFRYPGGKTWLIPYVRSWLTAREVPTRVLVEPFAGGGIVGLTSGFEGLAKHTVLVERDPSVAAVWQAILGFEPRQNPFQRWSRLSFQVL